MKIAYFGGDMFYGCMQLLLREGHEIVTLFTVPVEDGAFDITQHATKQAQTLNIPIIRRKPTDEDMQSLYELGCDMILSAGYGFKVPAHDEDKIPYAINVHPSLLPLGAGPMPMPMVIIKGLKETGLTLHKLTQDWDAGDIILQERFALNGEETLSDVLRSSQILAEKLLAQFLHNPKDCWSKAIPQQRSEGDYWPLLPKEDYEARYHKDFLSISRHLRAHRFIHPDGTVENVTHIRYQKRPHSYTPGTILHSDNGRYVIATRDGAIDFILERTVREDYPLLTPQELAK